jgi:hypothetical protein
MPNARHTDPITSHQAAASVENLSETKQIILSILRRYDNLTDEMLVKLYEARAARGEAPAASQSGIRSRRAELVRENLVQDSEARAKLSSGRNAILWSAV